MVDEKRFDYDKYIQERLREIDDLDERREAKVLLAEGLGRMMAWSEGRYAALEERVQRELEAPWRPFHTYTTIIGREDYDPINSFWAPLCMEDLQAGPGQGGRETVYLAADDAACRAFLQAGVVEAQDARIGQPVRLTVRRPSRYRACLEQLYALFSGNHVPWQTVHLGHLERFFDLFPEGEGDGETGTGSRRVYHFPEERWDGCIRQGMVPLWNIRQIPVRSREFRMPCIDEAFYEHAFYLPEEKGQTDGYLAQAGDEILSIRYEKDKIVLKTRRDTLEDISVCRLCQAGPEPSAGYRYPVLTNHRPDSLAARYLQKSGRFLQTPAELGRKVQEFAGGYRMEMAGFEILEKAEEGFLSGDMNGFTGARVFTDDRRKVLLIRLRQAGGYEDGYLLGAQVRYMLSQLQMEFLEYRCMGVVIK